MTPLSDPSPCKLKLETGVIRYEHDEGSQQTYTTSTTTVRQNVRGGPAKDDFEFDL